ncbi:RNA-directed DNA polymerase, eukaryota, partial [Tanacetum coccineum]
RPEPETSFIDSHLLSASASMHGEEEEEEVMYLVNETTGGVRKYDDENDCWKDVIEGSELLKGAEQMAIGGGKICVVSHGRIIVVDVVAKPVKMWVVDPPRPECECPIHNVPSMLIADGHDYHKNCRWHDSNVTDSPETISVMCFANNQEVKIDIDYGRRPCGACDNNSHERTVRHLVDSRLLVVDQIATRWNRCVPIKVNVFLWRLSLNKLPSRVNLDRKCIDVGSVLCPICQDDVESVNHTFFSCEMAKVLWDLLARWWELDIPVCANISEWYSWLDSLHASPKVRSFLEGVGDEFETYTHGHPACRQKLFVGVKEHRFVADAPLMPNVVTHLMAGNRPFVFTSSVSGHMFAKNGL